jgi:hypothetical protein
MHFCAEFKSTQSTQKQTCQRKAEKVRNTCFSELKSDNVTFVKFRAGVVLNVGTSVNFSFPFLRVRKVQKK